MPEQMAWSEAWRLFSILVMDPSSHVATVMAGWKYPATLTDLALADLFDLEYKKAKKNAKPYRRPWDKNETTTMGATRRGVSIDEFQAIMRRQSEEA